MSTPQAVVRIAATLDDLKRTLLEGRNEIVTTTAAMEKLAASFKGDKIIQAAHNVTAAVSQIGGASQLTEAEMARVNATLVKAIDKYKALGKDAPEAMQALEAATRKVTVPVDHLADEAAKLAKSLGGGDTIQSAHAYAKAVEQIGGASKLTAKEKERINAELTTAIEKYKALGQTAPAALVELEAATRKVEEQSRRTWDDIGKSLTSFANGARTIGMGLTATVTAPILGVAGAAIKLGMDAVESENLVSVSFGEMRRAAEEWSQRLSDALGLNEFELRKTDGTLFNMTTSMGLSKQAAFEMATGVAELAADMASFRNIPMEEALTKIKAGLTGETEPLKAIGILVDEATVKTYAYVTGIAKQGDELSQQQKVMARWQAILKQTSNDQGDLARTLDSPANQLRIMRTRVEEAATSLGVALMPIVQSVINGVATLVPYIQSAVKWFSDLSPTTKVAVVTVAALAAAAGPLVLVIAQIATGIAALIPLMGMLGISTTAVGAAFSACVPAVAVLAAALAGLKIGSLIGDMKLGQLTISQWVPVLMNWKLGLGGVSLENLKLAETSRARLAQHTQEVTAVTKLTEQTKAMTAEMKKEIEAQLAASQATAEAAAAKKAAEQAAKQYAKEIEKLRDQLSGDKFEGDLRKLTEAWRGLSAADKANQDVIERTVTAYLKLREAGAPIEPMLEAMNQKIQKITPNIIAWDLAQGKVTGTLDTMRLKTVEQIGQLQTLPLKLQETSETYIVMGQTMEFVRDQQEQLNDETTHWRDSLGELSGAVSGLGAAVGGSFGEIVEAVGTGIEVLERFDKAQQQMANAENWAQMAAGFTNAASAMITGFMALAQAIERGNHNELIADLMESTGRRYGLQLSRGMAEALAENIRLGENLGDLIFRNLDRVLADQGGATLRNYEQFAKILIEAMNQQPPGGNKDRAWIARHMAELEDKMNQVFPELARVVIESNGLAAQSFLDLIKREHELGLNTEAVTEFMRDRMTVAVDGLKTFVDNAAVTTQAAADGMVGAVIAMFDTMVQRGVPMTEILKQLDPVIAKLQKQFTAAGLSGGDAFAEVTRLASLARDEVAGPALTAVGGLNQALIAMQQSGMLNQQTFEGLARQVADTFKSLVDQGKSGDDILRLMQPTLQTIWELQQNFGYAVDESTQRLIDQAVEAGVVGDAHRDAQERVATAMQHVADTLDAIAIALGAIPPAAEDAARGVEDAIESLPRQIRIPIEFAANPPDFGFNDPDVPSFAAGSGGFRDFGRGTLAMLHGREAVVREGQPMPGSGRLESLMEQMIQAMADMPRRNARAIRDAQALAPR